LAKSIELFEAYLTSFSHERFVVAAVTSFFEAAGLASKGQLNTEFFNFDLLAAEV
jgi:hypothetical protein